MQTFLSYVALEEGYINFGDHNLEQKFHFYNNLLFDNSIPACPVVWADLHNSMDGLTTFTSSSIHLIPGTLKIQISNRFKMTEDYLNSTLIHEMIHAYFASHGRPKENHGIFFQSMAHKCGEKVGIKISLSDSITGRELANPVEVETTALLRFSKSRNKWFAIFYNGTALDSHEKQRELIAYWNRFLPRGEEIFVIKVHGSYIQKYGSVRSISSKFIAVSDSEAQSILQHGKIMLKIVSPPNSWDVKAA